MKNYTPDKEFKKLLSETRDLYCAARPGPKCPSVDQLVDYATDCGERSLQPIIELHLHDCLACRLVVIRVRASHFLWKSLVENQTEKALSIIMGTGK